MLCSNCGNTLQPGKTFCTYCGAAVEASQPQAQTTVQESSVAQNKKKIVWVAVLAMVAVIAVSALCIVLNALDTPKEIAEEHVAALYSYDFEAVLDTYPDFMLKAMAEKEFGMEKLNKKELVKQLEKLAEFAGADLDEEVEVEIVKSEVDEDIGENKAKKAIEEIFKTYGCEKYMSDIDDAAVVDISYESGDESDDVSVLCAKIDGDWYFIAIDE